MRTVAALYVDPRGPYPKMEGVDCWDEQRDARLYAGPHPVVAHPPCQHWGRLYRRATRPGKDCAPAAVEQVRRFGGVLEHPSASRLWADRLPRPGEPADEFGGYTIQLNQCDWGHCAEKKTWLYMVRVPPAYVEVVPSVAPTHVVSTSRRLGGSLPEMKKTERHITPPEFAAYLVRLARAAQ